MNKVIFLFIAFGCLGITIEIFFTALKTIFNEAQAGDKLSLDLTGESHIWMFFIYGLAGILFYLGYQYIADCSIIIRLALYVLSIYIVEFTTGWLLEKLTGRCPWEYESRWAVKGYIRLDYAPYWVLFGLIIENVYLILDGSVQF